GTEKETSAEDVAAACARLGVRVIPVRTELPDVRMQNVALLAVAAKEKLIPGVGVEHYEKALADLLPERALQGNLKVLKG
ncbi:MAG TPA: pyruvate ferredoxin oxidoreductase, partial [Aminobacteriaceae bacterium]|nr:pyruvate ferredoxin oxidoreductase [Aminobacteriaceae bacterium]